MTTRHEDGADGGVNDVADGGDNEANGGDNEADGGDEEADGRDNEAEGDNKAEGDSDGDDMADRDEADGDEVDDDDEADDVADGVNAEGDDEAGDDEADGGDNEVEGDNGVDGDGEADGGPKCRLLRPGDDVMSVELACFLGLLCDGGGLGRYWRLSTFILCQKKMAEVTKTYLTSLLQPMEQTRMKTVHVRARVMSTLLYQPFQLIIFEQNGLGHGVVL